MMEEKVIHEVRVIETEDGFRIEIKGDKEQIKAFMQRRGFFGQGMGPGGPFGFMRQHGPRGHHGHRGPWGRGGPFRGFGPWGWNEEEEQESPQRGSAADKSSDSPRA